MSCHSLQVAGAPWTIADQVRSWRSSGCQMSIFSGDLDCVVDFDT
ncbi:hypothetical protein [Hyphomicrobium sp. 1Nfss2.1]